MWSGWRWNAPLALRWVPRPMTGWQELGGIPVGGPHTLRMGAAPAGTAAGTAVAAPLAAAAARGVAGGTVAAGARARIRVRMLGATGSESSGHGHCVGGLGLH